MSSVTQLFLRFRPKSVKSPVHSTLRPPLFQRNVPWWAQWTWALIACDIFMTGSAIELTWNHWSSPVSKIELKPVQGNAEKDTPITLPEQYVLRPIWQRGGLCIAHFGFGVAIAVALLVTQARFVRTLAIVPASSFANQGSSAENRHVFLQCAHHFRKNGMVFPLNKCSLQEGRNETELVFRVTGEKGHWYVGLDNGTIYGRRVSPLEARKSILESWGGKRVGHWTQKYVADSRWKSGPIRRLEH